MSVGPYLWLGPLISGRARFGFITFLTRFNGSVLLHSWLTLLWLTYDKTCYKRHEFNLDFLNNADEEVPQIETSFLCCECLTDQTVIAFQMLHFVNYLLMYKEEDPKGVQVGYREFEQLQCPDGFPITFINLDWACTVSILPIQPLKVYDVKRKRLLQPSGNGNNAGNISPMFNQTSLRFKD